MLTLHLKKEWFEKIKSGEKMHEYREVKPYYETRLRNNASGYICFCLGYPKENECYKRLFAKIKNITIINGRDTDLKIDEPVYDIEFELLKVTMNKYHKEFIEKFAQSPIDEFVNNVRTSLDKALGIPEGLIRKTRHFSKEEVEKAKREFYGSNYM